MQRIKETLWACFAACLLLCALAGSAWAAEEPAHRGYLVVCPQPPVTRQRSAAATHVFGSVYRTESEEYARQLIESGLAEAMEPNYVATLFADTGAETNAKLHETMRTDCAAALGLDGSGVRIAVIDSGVAPDNPDLTEAKLREGYDYTANTTEMRDEVMHGTYVVQLICGDDNGKGVTGIARGSEIVPLRCFSSSKSADVGTLAQAINDAVTVYHCDMINMSWGLTEDSAVLHQAIRDAYDAGVILVSATGNVGSGFSQGSIIYPAAYEEVISVSALGTGNTVWSSSIQNEFVTVCAPGQSLPFTTAGGSITRSSGTSYASPIVCATLALVKQDAAPLNGADCLALLRDNAVDLGEPGRDDAYGYGLPRLDRLLPTHRAWLTEDETPLVTASMLSPSDGILILAFYDAQGRLCAIQNMSASGDDYRAVASCPVPEDAERCAVFFLDSGGSPRYGAERFSMTAAEPEPDADEAPDVT